MLEAAAAGGPDFHCAHAITTVQGDEKYLCVVGRAVRDPDSSAVREVTGYVIDVTQHMPRTPRAVRVAPILPIRILPDLHLPRCA